MTNMEIDQNKTCQLLGQMRTKTGPSSNMEMERESYSEKNNNLFFVNVNVVENKL